MRFLLSKLRKFGRDESGAFAILFGIMAVVLIAAGGSSVDFVAIQQARKTAQLSLDAATLGVASRNLHEGIQVGFKPAHRRCLKKA